MDRMDWRVKWVVGVALLCIVGTLLVYWIGPDINPSTHFGSAFASWVGGLVLFLLAGSVVAFVSFGRPENESFDARARILFRRQTGKHIDYIVDRITEVLEHYAEQTAVKVSIRGYDEATRRYRVASSTSAIVRSYLDDVETTYSSHLGRAEVTAPPPGGEPNRLVFARVAGTPVGATEEFQDSIKRPLSCRVERDGTCQVDTLVEIWIGADDEPNVYTPQRYTQLLTLTFENLISANVQVKLTTDGETNWVTEQLPNGIVKQLLEVRDLKPEQVVFDYRILAP